ncbi:ABC transporter substrate-binding protein [Tenggerimyces flavus]|uniref:ABC transporter substrate-binding protein n=1 Tax=Tenggerimyces flavus TaxID=1708749 RepID=A0ABV7YF86_9ACTN|nr:ABC transporter substrate-binding protein [Tenggerimyces flavus]MBM7791309.1 iron complex transport system substrate-binding protein [Tenggerimyces flavus]
MHRPGIGRRAALSAGIIALAGLAVGCGREAGPATAAAAPLELAHQYGSAKVPAKPARVVTMSNSWTDALIALDVPITAEFVTKGYAGKGNRFAWTPEHDSKIIEMTTIGEVDFEQLASFDPDLILAGYVGDQQVYQKLEGVAPTIPVMDKKAVLDTWQDVTTTAGRIFGQQDKATALVKNVEQELEDFKQEFPTAQGKTFVFGQLAADGQIGLVAAESDAAAKLIASTGLRLFPKLKEVVKGGDRVLVSQERTDLLEADVLVLWPLAGGPETFEKTPGWNDLPAVRNQATVFVTNDNAVGFGSPTIYSVPYVLDLLRPAVKAAT